MPTHRDYPWERDERRRREPATPGPWLGPEPQRRRRRPTRTSSEWALPLLLAVVVVLASLLIQRWEPAEPAAPTPRVASQHVVALHSRFAGRTALEVWGSVAAADGATVRIALLAPGGTKRRVARVPVRSGRFVARVAVPAPLRGRRVSVRARVER